MTTLVTVVGARPQFIKAATVSRALEGHGGVAEVLVHTGQHYDANMSDVFFSELALRKPDHALAVGSGPHGQQTGRMLERIERVLVEERADRVLVYGDTNSTLAAALAAAKLRIPVAHVEAGLRSFNRAMPEEINRVLSDHTADLLLAPTEAAVRNLAAEGVVDGVHRVGDVMYDLALRAGGRAAAESDILERLGLERDSFVLATVHRAENTDEPGRLRAIVEGLSALGTVPVVLPLHPRTRAALERDELLSGADRALRLIEPVGYIDMVRLEQTSRLVVTDSGGVQKEAFFHGVPCVTLRDETEWVELVDLGWNVLVPPSSAEAVQLGIRRALDAGPPAADPGAPYGDGRAAERIAELLAGAGKPR